MIIRHISACFCQWGHPMAKRQHKKKNRSVRGGEGVTVERCQHSDGVAKEIVDRDATGKVYMWRYRARSECMLDAYLVRKLIELEQHQAGMKYRIAWLRAREGIRVSDPYSGGAHASYEDSLQIIPESERLLREADQAMTAKQRDMVRRVGCDDKMAGGTDCLETLRRALDRLVRLWRIR